MTLSRVAGRSSFWMMAGNAGQQVFGFLVFIYLARVLTPADFGTIALAYVVTDILTQFGRLGQVEALQQRTELDRETASTAFWLLQGTGVLFSIAVYLLAGPVERLFAAPHLADVLRLLAPVCLLQCLGGVHEAWLRRGFGYRALAGRTFGAALAGSLAAATLAALGCGIYALVAQRLVMVLTMTALVWISYRWLPDFSFRFDEARRLLRTGFEIMTASIMNLIGPRVVDAIVGLFLGVALLGQLRIAWRIVDFVNQLTFQPVLGVALSSLSRLQNDKPALRRAFLRFVQVSGLATIPVFVGLALIAVPLFDLMLGPQWAPAVPLFQILVLVSLAAPVNFFFAPTMIAVGATRTVFRQAMLQFVLTAGLAALAAQIGLKAVLAAHVLRTYIMSVLNIAALRRHADLPVFETVRTLVPAACAAAAMAAAVLARQVLYPIADPWMALLADIALGAAVYTAVLLAGDFARIWPRHIRNLGALAREVLRREDVAIRLP